MKIRILTALALAVCSAAAVAQTDTRLESVLQRYSYGLGLQVGQSLRQQGLDEIDAAALALAIGDVLAGAQPRVTQDEMRAAVAEYREQLTARRTADGERNRAAGAKFLAGNRDREGVVALDSGVQYRVVETGSGSQPVGSSTVIVHYRGKLLDGTEFDSSFRRGEPTELGVGQVIPGWQEALKLMREGDRWEVWIPGDQAYGPRGAGQSIGPHETLHFEIELIEVKGAG